jgi:hypothetical protein
VPGTPSGQEEAVKTSNTVLAVAALLVCAWAAGNATVGPIGMIPSTFQPAARMACAMEARLVPAPETDWSFPRVLDTSMLLSYSADHDPLTGYYYAAVGTRTDSLIKLYRSTDYGATWNWLCNIIASPACLFYKLDLVVARGDSSFLHVFARWGYNGGDIYDYRISLDGAPFSYFGVATGPDTVDDFSACADYRPQYGLYCFWANQQREGTNGGFMTSTDYGVTWSSQNAGSAWDVDVSATADNDINAAFVAAPSRKQVIYQRNDNYGDPSGWLSTVSVAYDTMQHYNPRVISALTLPDSSATTWLMYHYDWQNSGDWDIEYAIRSNVWADTWNRGYTLSNEAGAFEYLPDLTNYKEPGSTQVAASYSRVNAARDTGFVFWQTADAASPMVWTPRQVANDTLRPVDIYVGSALVGGSANGGVVFSKGIPGNLLPIGLYYNGSSLGGVEEGRGEQQKQTLRVVPNPSRGRVAIRYMPAQAGPAEIGVYDQAGRLVRALAIDCQPSVVSRVVWDGRNTEGDEVMAGVYFVQVSAGESRQNIKLVVR